jgi:hypothetical protein
LQIAFALVHAVLGLAGEQDGKVAVSVLMFLPRIRPPSKRNSQQQEQQKDSRRIAHESPFYPIPSNRLSIPARFSHGNPGLTSSERHYHGHQGDCQNRRNLKRLALKSCER